MALGLMVAGLAACDNRPDIAGTWQGNVRNALPGQTQEMTVTYDFGKDGKVNTSYLITISEPLPEVDSLVAPYQINVAATATINGTWRYVDGEDDDVSMTLDPASLSVNIDPDAVTFRTNVITAQQAPVLDSLKPAAIAHYTQIVTEAVKRQSTTVVLEDIEIKDPLMKFEINDRDYTFHRDAQPQPTE